MADTKAIWRKRVASWRASGQTAAAFSARQGFAPTTLLWWSSRLGRESGEAPVIRVARVMRPVEPAQAGGEIVVEYLERRVRVTIGRGSEQALVVAVLERLEGAR